MPLERSNRADGERFLSSLPLVEQPEMASGLNRRDFLRLAGFAVIGATVGCRRAPVQYALPYLTAPADIVPGRSYYYASTCGACSAGCGVLVKNRDGRPIKLEGNPDHPLSRGGLCAVGQASLLGLYDRQRLPGPRQGSDSTDWAEVDRAIRARLDDIRAKNGAVRFLTGPGLGPTATAWVDRFLKTFQDGQHIVHDPRSCSAIARAHERTHGAAAALVPSYHLEKADVIVSFDADFLGTWISPVEFSHAYASHRTPSDSAPTMSYHVQFESLLTLTGTKADERIALAPTEFGATMNYLTARLAAEAKVWFSEKTFDPPPSIPRPLLDHIVDQLWNHRSIVLCGSQNVELQVLTNFMNYLLGNYGETVDLKEPSYQNESTDPQLETLLRDLDAGKIAALFVHGTNPVHDLPNGDGIAEDLKRIPLLVSLSPRLDETAQLAHYICPDHHYLEAWGDAEPVNGKASLVQPAITPLGGTRSLLESLATWSGDSRPAYELVRDHWENVVFRRQTKAATFQEFWDTTLEQGFASLDPRPVTLSAFNLDAVNPAVIAASRQDDAYSLVLYHKVGMRGSSHACNPWLHELPDPITKVTWDNYACVSPATAKALGAKDGDVIRLEVGDGRSLTLELPALVQPGQHDKVVAVALGYGSVLSERFAKIGPQWLQARPTVGEDGRVGKNAAPLLQWRQSNLCRARDDVHLHKTGAQHPLASTQDYYQVSVPRHLALPGQEMRPIIRESSLDDHQHAAAGQKAAAKSDEGLWPDDHHQPDTVPRWGMAIDLNACTGCSACIIACQAENNIPVVGKDEISRRREMHWLRIDRYYTVHADGVDVAHQPMLCHHCGNAPCEVVCPVLATAHSDEGLNQQVYNRCVGTRYCANNCPYKVRRFNWFDYAHNDALQNLVLNPEVTVRSRGVMEKCTFCVQRIQDARLSSGHHSGERLPDGLVQTACQQSCPAQAIVFGDLHDPKSRVARLLAGSRSYQVLGELNIKPAVSYLTLVRNRPAREEGGKNG